MSFVQFPAVVHLRCTEAMREEVKARGGCRWLRSIVAANTRPPGIDNPGTLDKPFSAWASVSPTPAKVSRRSRRDTPAGSRKVSRRVSLDKRKRRKV